MILDVLLQKSEHVERFVEYSHKPRLHTRFQQRLGEYRAFWSGVQAMCHQFTAAVSLQTGGGVIGGMGGATSTSPGREGGVGGGAGSPGVGGGMGAGAQRALNGQARLYQFLETRG